MHPCHDVGLGEQAPEIVSAIIEVPASSNVKYELDKKSGLLRVDRTLFSSVHYPANYGFLPQTYCDDHDPLDVLVLGQEPLVPLCIVRAKPIGLMKMIDQGKSDDKVIAVHFSEAYKALENKTVSVEGFLGATETIEAVKRSMQMYV